MEESIHGQDDVRTSLARPYVLRLYAQRASRGAAPAAGGCGRMSARVTTIAAGVDPGRHRRRGASAAPGRWPPAGSTAPG